MRRRKLDERFWSLVDRSSGTDACWPWKGSLHEEGYGLYYSSHIIPGRTCHMAHRLAFEEMCNIIPQGLCVLHRCDNRRCCNPRHHFLGTRRDNAADRDAKGRLWSRGEKHPNSKLTWDDVHAMRRERRLGASLSAIACRYKISRENVGSILRGERWVSDGGTAVTPLFHVRILHVSTEPYRSGHSNLLTLSCGHIIRRGARLGIPKVMRCNACRKAA